MYQSLQLHVSISHGLTATSATHHTSTQSSAVFLYPVSLLYWTVVHYISLHLVECFDLVGDRAGAEEYTTVQDPVSVAT